MIEASLSIALVLGATILHGISDVLLLWGIRSSDGKAGIEVLVHTPRKFLLIGAFLGFLTIPFWFIPGIYLLRIEGPLGTIIFLSFVTHIATLLLFHISYAFIGVGIQKDSSLIENFAPLLRGIGAYSMAVALLVSILLMVAAGQGAITLRWYHYTALPFFSILIIQGLISRLLKVIPFFQAVSGTIAMGYSLISLIDALGP